TESAKRRQGCGEDRLRIVLVAIVDALDGCWPRRAGQFVTGPIEGNRADRLCAAVDPDQTRFTRVACHRSPLLQAPCAFRADLAGKTCSTCPCDVGYCAVSIASR